MADANPFEDLIPQRTENPFADLIPAKDAEAADHGLSERQKLSLVGKAISPVTSYPDTYQRMNKEARGQVSRGLEQIANHESMTDLQAHGISDVLTGAANVGLGTLGYVASPISAAYRSVVGQPIEDVTGIPREYTEFAAQLATPGIGLPGSARAPAPNLPRPAVAAPANEIVDAARRVSEVAPAPINVPRAFASDNMAVQRTAQGIRNIPVIGDAIPKATGEMTDQLGNAVSSIASSYGEGSGPNVAGRIGRAIGSQAEAETRAAGDAAAQGDAAVLAAWERAHAGARDAIGSVESGAANTARASVGDMNPQEMGAVLIARLRQGEREAHATKERLYGVAANSDGAIDARAVRGVRGDVTRALDEDGLVIDPTLTPAAQRMIVELDNTAKIRMPNRVDPASVSETRGVQGGAARPADTNTPQKGKPSSGVETRPSLLEFIASKGGLGPDVELEAIGAHGHTLNVEGVGRRKLVRQGGLPLDYAREAAEEAGYLRGDHNGTSTVNDLLDAIDAEVRGQSGIQKDLRGPLRSARISRVRREKNTNMNSMLEALRMT